MKTKLFLLIMIIGSLGFAQTEAPKNKPLKFNLNEDGSHYVRFTFLSQIWLRHTQTNPGSTLFGKPVDGIFDIGLRRTRLQMFGQISDRIFFYTQFGLNNFNYTSQRYAGAFFHDALIEYAVVKRNFTLGGGLTGWQGLSRYASPSVGSIMSLDAPLFQQATNGASDQFLRKLSVYAKGKLGKLDYRLALSNPMTIQTAVAPISPLSPISDFSLKPPKVQTHGYFMYQFLDEETNTTPYTPGTYLGKKNIFNVGAGFVYQPDAMWHLDNLDTVSTALAMFSVDVFFEKRLHPEKEKAVTLYLSYHNLNYGPNYTRNVGVMNPANGVDSSGTFNGAGNAFTMVGTGHVFYGQMGFLLCKHILPKGLLQPYVAMQYGIYERYKDPMVMYEAGVNWYINGTHGQKLTVNYQSRPVFERQPNSEITKTQRKGMFTLQFQIAI